MKGILIILIMLAFNLSAQDNDSLSLYLRFEKGYFFSKKGVIKINGKKTSNFTIKTVPHLATSLGRFDIHIKKDDEVTIKIGALTRKKIDNSKIKDGFIYVYIKRILFFDFVSYERRPTLYE